jgi:hypothetical protein
VYVCVCGSAENRMYRLSEVFAACFCQAEAVVDSSVLWQTAPLRAIGTLLPLLISDHSGSTLGPPAATTPESSSTQGEVLQRWLVEACGGAECTSVAVAATEGRGLGLHCAADVRVRCVVCLTATNGAGWCSWSVVGVCGVSE